MSRAELPLHQYREELLKFLSYTVICKETDRRCSLSSVRQEGVHRHRGEKAGVCWSYLCSGSDRLLLSLDAVYQKLSQETLQIGAKILNVFFPGYFRCGTVFVCTRASADEIGSQGKRDY
jgi:hypothetical protein